MNTFSIIHVMRKSLYWTVYSVKIDFYQALLQQVRDFKYIHTSGFLSSGSGMYSLSSHSSGCTYSRHHHKEMIAHIDRKHAQSDARIIRVIVPWYLGVGFVCVCIYPAILVLASIVLLTRWVLEMTRSF